MLRAWVSRSVCAQIVAALLAVIVAGAATTGGADARARGCSIRYGAACAPRRGHAVKRRAVGSGRVLSPAPAPLAPIQQAPLPRPDFAPRPIQPGRTPPPDFLQNRLPPVFAPQPIK